MVTIKTIIEREYKNLLQKLVNRRLSKLLSDIIEEAKES